MATRKSSRRPHHVDHHGHAAATLEAPVSARCELGDCSGCHGEVLSLLHPVGTKCSHPCHTRPGVAA